MADCREAEVAADCKVAVVVGCREVEDEVGCKVAVVVDYREAGREVEVDGVLVGDIDLNTAVGMGRTRFQQCHRLQKDFSLADAIDLNSTHIAQGLLRTIFPEKIRLKTHLEFAVRPHRLLQID